MSKPGTEWVAPGQGSTIADLETKFFLTVGSHVGEFASVILRRHEWHPCLHTNLRLTGAPITEEDWARLGSAEFKVGE